MGVKNKNVISPQGGLVLLDALTPNALSFCLEWLLVVVRHSVASTQCNRKSITEGEFRNDFTIQNLAYRVYMGA